MKIARHEKFYNHEKRLSLSYVGSFFALAVLFASLVIGLFGFYVEHWYRGPAGVVARVFPIPAAMVERDVIWYADVAKMAGMMDSIQKKANAENNDPFNLALKRLIADKQLEQFSASLGVYVSQSSVQNYTLNEPGLVDFLEAVNWSEADYRKYIITPLLVAQDAERKVAKNPEFQTEPLEKIAKILNDLDLGFNFTDLAITRSDDLSAPNGGNTGYFTKDELPALYKDMFEAELGTVSPILEGDDFYSIAKVVDISGDPSEPARVALQVITVNKTEMLPSLTKFKEQSKIKFFVR